MKKITLLSFILCLGCANCSSNQQEPNIRQMPWSEFCPQACIIMSKQHLNCEPYANPIPIDDDGGTWTCSEFFTYENKNSIPLNCKCMAQITSCSQIDCASRLENCNNDINILCP